MSVSSLPEWKQLLLERKRREEEERERREKQEEEKFASMPAWKRGIIQRRKAKQDSLGDRERDKDVCQLQVDVRSPSDGLSDTDSSITVNFGSELSLSPDTGQWQEAEVKAAGQVSVETIVPLHENPFIRTQSSWRKSRDGDLWNEPEGREKEKLTPRSQDLESGRGRDVELKIDRFSDLSEGSERDKGKDRSQGREKERGGWERDRNQWKESVKDATREREVLKVLKDEDDLQSSSFSPHVPCLRTIRADNIIIIEQDRKVSNERRSRWRETETERLEEDQGKRGMKMDLREILGVGGSVTEIRASEVLIIKPSASPEQRSPKGGGGGGGRKGSSREDGDAKGSTDGRQESFGRELRTDLSWLRDKEKDRPWGQATVIKDDRKDSLEDNVFVDRGGRVSQLLSKFGEHPKPPSRSKSSDNFLRPGRRTFSGDEVQQSEANGRNTLWKNVPKRSFSFSDRVFCSEENGLDDGRYHERKMRDRIHSDKSVAPWMDGTGPTKIKLGYARLSEKDKLGKQRERQVKDEDEKVGTVLRRNENEISIHSRKVEPVDMPTAKEVDVYGDEGFTTASVKNTEGISFARRVPIRQDGKARAEREARNLAGEKSLERKPSAEKDSELGRQTEAQASDENVPDYWRDERLESVVSVDSTQKNLVSASAEVVSSSHATENQYRHESAFTECSSLLCAAQDRGRDTHRGPEWSGTGPQGPHLMHSVLSQHTEDLISKIEKIGDASVYNNEKPEQVYNNVSTDTTQEAQSYSDAGSDGLMHDLTPRSQKTIEPSLMPPAPLEIQIPRSVFYVAEEMMDIKMSEGQINEEQDWVDSVGVERRDSWRIGKPLSRIESLREKIRQREAEDRGSEGAEIKFSQTAEERCDEGGSEVENKSEATAHMQKRPVKERPQEDAAEQTSTTAFDVTQEVSVLKTCPQLPASVPQSQSVSGEEVTSGYAAAASDVIDDFKTSEDEDDPVKHVEEQLRRHRAKHEDREDREEEEDEESEEELQEYASPSDSVESLSPLPPYSNSLAAMSRIYNLETIGSRSGLCLREKTVEIPSVHLVKVKPLMSNAQQLDSKAFSGEDVCGVQTIQRQIEQFQLKEQEVLKSCSSTNIPFKDWETKGRQSPQGLLWRQLKDDINSQEKDQETSSLKVTSGRVQSPTSQLKQSNQTITVTPALLRSQSPDNTLKPTDCAPTPASSPCSPSPVQSPSVSPSPTASPTLFSIRSASGGKVKRGATITICPKKSVSGGGGSTSTKTLTQPAQTPADQEKKKYPTVDEIEVIGGYQTLEKSCLIKNRGTPKKVKVCFHEDQLEQVCEYPSETSMLSHSPYPQDLWTPQGDEGREEHAQEEGGTVVSKKTRNVGTATGRGPRVETAAGSF
ncbi:microtubule-associated protein futsch isoform X2 [Antennarius striatus]|uniref:microtubule-associated protein futsch isoform X2 n=1 Tax=Antennarius striatus TaxID=241820 RepID=UPI0035B0DCA6